MSKHVRTMVDVGHEHALTLDEICRMLDEAAASLPPNPHWVAAEEARKRREAITDTPPDSPPGSS